MNERNRLQRVAENVSDAEQNDDSVPFFSLRLKFLIGFTLLFTVVFALTFLWTYPSATERAVDRVVEDMRSTLDGAVVGIDTEAFARLAAGVRGEPDPELYQEHLDWLAIIRQIEPRAVVYTFIPTDQPYEVLWIGDVTMTYDPENAAAFGEAYLADPTKTNLYSGLTDVIITRTPYDDRGGRWVSAYQPIVDASGEVIGGMGVDFDANYVSQIQQSIPDRIFVAFLIAYSMLLATILFVSHVLTRPIQELTTMAARVGAGDYDQDFRQLVTIHRFRDEIDVLAQAFATMADKVRDREIQLRAEVEHLRVKIDTARKEEQVAEIVSTDFFRDLQSKVESMKQRNNAKPLNTG